ncbi:MAG: DUF1624 domain-containing protein [Bacteroidetes bacterium]|nr:DUF1624 domain-containing protein [Bacteroidota bacterium]
MSPNYRKRIIFLDLMRAMAVLMMVQGHTIDTFLGDQYRTFDSSMYDVWLTIRGFTAPIFMFTSGVAFTYLLKSHSQPFFENPRVAKGFRRFLVLVLIGYMLRFPTPRMFDFSQVTHYQWLTFFTVDALHLIGIGLFLILLLTYIAERYRLNEYAVFIFGIIFFFIAYRFTESLNWANHLPIPFAAYFYQGTGSLFPIFPWAGYVIAGGILGMYLAKNPECYLSPKFSYKLFAAGGFLIFISYLVYLANYSVFGDNKEFFSDTVSLVYYRLGIVLALNGAMALISMRLKTMPDLVQQVGKNTLLIYVVHIIILYGSAWIPGFGMFYPKSLNAVGSVSAAILLIILMVGMVAVVEKLKTMKKRKLAAVEV